jgi:hypothetical protein
MKTLGSGIVVGLVMLVGTHAPVPKPKTVINLVGKWQAKIRLPYPDYFHGSYTQLGYEFRPNGVFIQTTEQGQSFPGTWDLQYNPRDKTHTLYLVRNEQERIPELRVTKWDVTETIADQKYNIPAAVSGTFVLDVNNRKAEELWGASFVLTRPTKERCALSISHGSFGREMGRGNRPR